MLPEVLPEKKKKKKKAWDEKLTYILEIEYHDSSLLLHIKIAFEKLKLSMDRGL